MFILLIIVAAGFMMYALLKPPAQFNEKLETAGKEHAEEIKKPTAETVI
ncbi:hypothetical protein AB6A23_04890 [Paenibacillus tarimensis]